MFLRNFDHGITAMMLYTSQYASGTIATVATGASTTLQTTAGSAVDCRLGSGGSYGQGAAMPIAFGTGSICIGSGNTPVTYDDYRLAGTWTSGTFTAVSNNLAYDESRKVWIRTVTVKFQNTGTVARTVAEWGIYRTVTASSESWNNNSSGVALVYREVLAEPAVIEEDTIATLTFTLEIPHEVNAQ